MAVRTNSDEALEELKRRLDRIESRDNGMFFSLAETLRSVIAAVEYKDETLLQAARQSLIDRAEEFIIILTNDSKSALRSLEENMEAMSGRMISPHPDLDEFGETLQRIVQGQLKRLTDLYRSLVPAFKDVTLTGSGPLQNEINRWRGFEDSYLKEWPWTSRKRNPVNRELLAASQAARERGENGIPVKDLINKLNVDDSSCKHE